MLNKNILSLNTNIENISKRKIGEIHIFSKPDYFEIPYTIYELLFLLSLSGRPFIIPSSFHRIWELLQKIPPDRKILTRLNVAFKRLCGMRYTSGTILLQQIVAH